MPAPFRAAALITLALAAPAAAKPSLWDLVTPERIAARLIQTAIIGLRTQADITYSGISVSPLTGMATLTDLHVQPFPAWDADGACLIAIDRLLVRTAAVDDIDTIRLKAQAAGATIPAACLPPEAQGGAGMLGLDEFALSRLSFDIDYRISSAEAQLHAYARADALAAVTVEGDLSYFALDGRKDMDNPEPVMVVRSARATVENLGLWDKVKGLAPPPFTDPASAQGTVESLFDTIPGIEPGSDDAAALDVLKSSTGESWAAFVADPKVIVLETGFDPMEPVYLDPARLKSGPQALLGYLHPQVVLTPAPARAILPAALVTAMDGDAGSLADDDRLTLGLALASGIGAPRDIDGARALLAPLAEAGEAEAAAALARALETRDPRAAYGYALTAAAAGAAQAGALLDRLEAALPFTTVLELQDKAVEGVEHPASALDDLARVREQALMRLTGKGQTRSYATAMLWALIGAAAGDGESADLLEEIDERIRLAGPEAAPVWAAQEQAASALARQAWTSFDLPARFGGVN